MLEHHVGAVVEHEADEAEHVGRAVGFLLVGVGRQRLRQQPLGHRLVVVNAEQLPLDLLQRRPVGPLDVALEQAVLRHQDAAEAFRVDRLLVELPHAVGAVEAEIDGAGDAAAGHRGGHALQVLGGVADEVLDRLTVDERGRSGILQRR